MPPLRSTPFPRSTFSQVWGLVVTTLMNDPVLQPGVNLWQVWNGGADDRMEPTERHCPFIRLTPKLANSKWCDESSHDIQMLFVHDFGVTGTRVSDIFDFWMSITNAWFGGSNSLYNALIPYGVWQKTITAPPMNFGQAGEGPGLRDKGTITIDMRITT